MVNRDLAALKHMLHKAEKWGYLEVSPGRHVELLTDDSTVRTDYFSQDDIKRVIAKAEEDRQSHPNYFNDWPEFIQLDVNTGLRCREMLFLEFADIDWTAGVLHVRNKKHLGFSPKGRKERRIPLNDAAFTALQSMLSKKRAATASALARNYHSLLTKSDRLTDGCHGDLARATHCAKFSPHRGLNRNLFIS